MIGQVSGAVPGSAGLRRLAVGAAPGLADGERVSDGDAGGGGDGLEDLLVVRPAVADGDVGPVLGRVGGGAVPAHVVGGVLSRARATWSRLCAFCNSVSSASGKSTLNGRMVSLLPVCAAPSVTFFGPPAKP